MAGRRLTPEEIALWRRVQSGVRPIDRHHGPLPEQVRSAPTATAPPRRAAVAPLSPARPAVPLRPVPARSDTLDGGWDRRIARGAVMPDCTIDLHGHSLATAHRALDQGIEAAIARGDRVLLVVTGKPPRAESERPHARGAIRAAIGDWLAGSRHAHRIAAIRGAHPRHGGTGALYLVLRRLR